MDSDAAPVPTHEEITDLVDAVAAPYVALFDRAFEGAGWSKDEFGTWYWPESNVTERDRVAETVASWDLAALGVVP